MSEAHNGVAYFDHAAAAYMCPTSGVTAVTIRQRPEVRKPGWYTATDPNDWTYVMHFDGDGWAYAPKGKHDTEDVWPGWTLGTTRLVEES